MEVRNVEVSFRHQARLEVVRSIKRRLQYTTEMENLNVEEVCTLLESKGFEPDIIGVLRRQKVAGCILVDMDDAEMTEIGIEAWGDRRRLRKLISSGCFASQPEKTRSTAKQGARITTSPSPRTYEVVSYSQALCC